MYNRYDMTSLEYIRTLIMNIIDLRTKEMCYMKSITLPNNWILTLTVEHHTINSTVCCDELVFSINSRNGIQTFWFILDSGKLNNDEFEDFLKIIKDIYDTDFILFLNTFIVEMI